MELTQVNLLPTKCFICMGAGRMSPSEPRRALDPGAGVSGNCELCMTGMLGSKLVILSASVLICLAFLRPQIRLSLWLKLLPQVINVLQPPSPRTDSPQPNRPALCPTPYRPAVSKLLTELMETILWMPDHPPCDGKQKCSQAMGPTDPNDWKPNLGEKGKPPP